MKRENRNKREGLESGVEGFPVLLLHPHGPQHPHRGRSLACWRQGGRGWRRAPTLLSTDTGRKPQFHPLPFLSHRICQYLSSQQPSILCRSAPYLLPSPGFLFPDVSLSPHYIISSISYVKTKICHISPRGHTASNTGQRWSPGPGSRW